MTDIRELLRDATADLGFEPDPVARVGRATTRRLQRTGFGAVVAIAVVVAAIVAPLALTGGGTARVQNANQPPRVTPGVHHWSRNDSVAAFGFGQVWGLDTSTATVDVLNATTGKQVKQIPVPAPASMIATGAGAVWVVGSSAAQGGQLVVSAINPSTHDVMTGQVASTTKPFGIALAHHSAWVTVPTLNKVWRFTVTAWPNGQAPGTMGWALIPVAGSPRTITATGNGAVWVQRASAKKLSRIASTGKNGGGRIATTVSWPGMLFSAAGHTTLWATFRQHTILELEPQFLTGCSACAQVDNIVVRGRFTGAVSTPRGLFATVVDGPGGSSRTDFWSNKALGRSSETPTAHVPYSGSLTADGPGVVIGAGSKGLIDWVPAR